MSKLSIVLGGRLALNAAIPIILFFGSAFAAPPTASVI